MKKVNQSISEGGGGSWRRFPYIPPEVGGQLLIRENIDQENPSAQAQWEHIRQGSRKKTNKQLEKHRTCLQSLIEKYFKDMLKASPIHA